MALLPQETNPLLQPIPISDVSLMKLSGKYIRTFSQEMLKTSITTTYLKITHEKLQPHLPGPKSQFIFFSMKNRNHATENTSTNLIGDQFFKHHIKKKGVGGGHLNISLPSYRYRNSIYNEKTASWLSPLYNTGIILGMGSYWLSPYPDDPCNDNPYTWKDVLDIETRAHNHWNKYHCDILSQWNVPSPVWD